MRNFLTMLLTAILICVSVSLQAQSLIISEFRTSGPSGSADEYVEIYNNSNSNITVPAAGYVLVKSGATAADAGVVVFIIPSGTVIPARAHFLIVGSSYSLSNYGGTNAATGNGMLLSDIENNRGLALFNTSDPAGFILANRLDAVGSSTEANPLYKESSGYPAPTVFSLEAAFKRKTYDGVPQDSDNNSNDFVFVDVTGSQQRLGAPGPENLNSPVSRNAAVVITRLDQTTGVLALPNTLRDLTNTGSINPLGTIEFRYRLTNNTGVPLTRIRFRLDSLTTLAIGSGKADLRAMTSANITLNGVNDAVTCSSTGTPATPPCSVTVLGTSVEQPPTQAAGGGFNSTLTLMIPSPIAAGGSINFRIVFGVMAPGDYSVLFTPEVLPNTAAIGPVPPPEKMKGVTDPTSCSINQAPTQVDPTGNSPINFKVVFNGWVTGFTSSDVTLNGTAGATTAVITEIAPNDGTTYNVAVSGMTNSGTVTASISASVVLNSVNSGNAASSSTDNTVTYSGPPTVTINKSVGQADPAINIPVRFTVEFSEEVAGFDASDISFAGSTVPGTLAATITGTGPTYTVAVTGMTGAGDVVANIPAGAATNANGLTSLTSTSTDNVIQLLIFENEFIITKNAVSPFVAAGGVITYFINVGRLPVIGTNPPYQNVEVTDLLPNGTTFISFEPVDVNTTIPIIILPPVNTNGTVRLVFPIFMPLQNFSFLLRVRIAEEMTGTISNTATVNGPLGDVNPANNSATANVQVSVPPTITCPQNIVVNTEEGLCRSEVLFTDENEIIITGIPAPKISYKITNTSGGSSFGSNLDAFPSSLQFPIGVHTVEVTATNSAGSQSCSFTVTVNDNQAPVITCPSNITVNSAAGKCSADVLFTFNVQDICSTIDLPVSVAISTGVTVTFSGSTLFTFTTTGTFPVGINSCTLIATDAYGNTSTCSFTVTVLDKEKPVIILKPADVTVECASQIPAVNISSVTASDNCGTATISHVSDVISNQTCANKYKITRTYQATDGSGNTETVVQLITVDDKTPPTITGLTPSKRILAPPNHKMVDIYLDYIVADNCSDQNVRINITSNEPVNGTGDGDTDPDWEVVDDHHIRLRAERSAHGTGRIYTITVTVSDGCNADVSATTEVRVTHNITGPHSGNSFKVGSTVAFTGEFWDVPGNKHTAKWLIDGTSVNGVVTEAADGKNGKVNGSYKFTTPGVYKLQMNVTDQKGVTTYANTNGDLEAIVVIYDPNGGYTYGGGYYNSPQGALIADPSSTGKTSYGFAMNYFKNSTNPKGETQFEFKVGDFEFNALNFDYLVISNSMAQFKGTGKIIGGQSGVAFTMTVVDGQLDGTGIDKIRMKIYNRNNGKIIYDNQPGASDAALPTQAVGANSVIVIGAGIKQSATPANEVPIVRIESNLLTERFEVGAFPNPHQGTFSLRVQSPKPGKMTIEYFTMTGAKIYMLEQKVKAYEQIIVPNIGLKFNGTIFYKVSIDGLIKTGKIIGIK